MFELIRSVGAIGFARSQAPVLTLSLVVAELFYKFHSFTLECIAFLATWYVLDAISARLMRPKQSEGTQPL